MLQCCVCRLSVTLCIVAEQCVLEQKLLLWDYRVVYEKSIGAKMNDLELCLEVVSMSCQPLRYIRRWIYRKPLPIEAWFQRTINRKWPTRIKWLRDRWRHVTLKGQTRDPNTLRAQWPENSWRYYFATIANYWIEAVRLAILATAWLFISRPYRAVAVVIQCCLRPSIAVVCNVMYKRCVLEQKLPLTAYRKSIGTKMNDLDLCLEVVWRSCQPLRYIRRWMSRKPLKIETWDLVPKNHQ